jgi:hypothetical protein
MILYFLATKKFIIQKQYSFAPVVGILKPDEHTPDFR